MTTDLEDTDSGMTIIAVGGRLYYASVYHSSMLVAEESGFALVLHKKGLLFCRRSVPRDAQCRGCLRSCFGVLCRISVAQC